MVVVSDSAMKAKRSKPWEDDYRIPNDTYAHHYDLYLHPDLEAGTFSGKVTVHITASNSVRENDTVYTELRPFGRRFCGKFIRSCESVS